MGQFITSYDQEICKGPFSLNSTLPVSQVENYNNQSSSVPNESIEKGYTKRETPENDNISNNDYDSDDEPSDEFPSLPKIENDITTERHDSIKYDFL